MVQILHPSAHAGRRASRPPTRSPAPSSATAMVRPVPGRPIRPATAPMTAAARFAACCRPARRSSAADRGDRRRSGCRTGGLVRFCLPARRTLAPARTRRRVRHPPFPDDLEHPMIGAATAVPVGAVIRAGQRAGVRNILCIVTMPWVARAWLCSAARSPSCRRPQGPDGAAGGDRRGAARRSGEARGPKAGRALLRPERGRGRLRPTPRHQHR